MKIRVRFFGYVGEIAGMDEEFIEIQGNSSKLSAVLEEIFRRVPAVRKAADRSMKYAVNLEYAKPETPVKDGDCVSFIPPVAGG